MVDGVSSHFLENRLLIFSEQRQTLYKLNESAAFIWLCCEESQHIDGIAGSLAEKYGIPFKAALNDVWCAVSEWIDLGLLAPDGRPRPSREGEDESGPMTDDEPETSDLSSKTEFQDRFFFSLAGCDFLVRCSRPEEATHVRPIFAHLEKSHSENPSTVIDIIHDGMQHVVIRDDLVAGKRPRPDQLGSLLSREALRAVFQNRDLLVGVHAAVIGDGRKCIIFAGRSAVGKTTLAAALMNAGFLYFTDELAIIDRATRLVIPCPVSLRVKDGSWETVAGLWKTTPSALTTYALNELRIRYLSPIEGGFAADPKEALPAGFLIFPQYSPNAGTSLSVLGRVEALQRLQEAGYALKYSLNTAKVSEMVDWIKSVECYEMKVGSLQSAVSIVKDLFG